MIKEVIHDFAKWLQKKSYVAPEPKVEFYSIIEGLERWQPIVRANKFVPSWYKDLPKFHADEDVQDPDLYKGHLPSGTPIEWGTRNQTIKTCPGMQDIMTQGFYNLFWSQALIEVSQAGDFVCFTPTNQGGYVPAGDDNRNADYTRIKTSKLEDVVRQLKGRGLSDADCDYYKKQYHDKEFTSFSTHPPGQYDTMKPLLPRHYSKQLLKLHSPWRIITPKGWSTIVTNPVYHFHPVLETMTGIIDTDFYHMFNSFFFLRDTGLKFELTFGTPIAWYLIVKREDFPYEIRQASANDYAHERVLQNHMNSRWGSAAPYREMKKIYKGGKCPYGHDEK
tara:strand:- start:4966 stop:5970 length:1005 start_codon:yes stop_codon:yes gene_type:complete